MAKTNQIQMNITVLPAARVEAQTNIYCSDCSESCPRLQECSPHLSHPNCEPYVAFESTDVWSFVSKADSTQLSTQNQCLRKICIWANFHLKKNKRTSFIKINKKAGILCLGIDGDSWKWSRIKPGQVGQPLLSWSCTQISRVNDHKQMNR